METKVSEAKAATFHPQSFTINANRTAFSTRDVVFVDVRDEADFQIGKITGAINIPLSKVESALNSDHDVYSSVFQEEQTVVFYCKCGGMSAKACEIAEKAGFTNAKYLEGGYAAWKEQVQTAV